jgi:hypothetical protein
MSDEVSLDDLSVEELRKVVEQCGSSLVSLTPRKQRKLREKTMCEFGANQEAGS